MSKLIISAALISVLLCSCQSVLWLPPGDGASEAALTAEPIPEPAEPMKPLEPGVHILELPLGQVPVLVSGEDTPELGRLNREIIDFVTEHSADVLRSYSFEYDGYMQAVVTSGPERVRSFVYDTDRGHAVGITEAIERYNVDIAALYPRYEAKLHRQGRVLSGMYAKAFRYLEGGGVELIFLIRSRTGYDKEYSLCVYNSLEDSFYESRDGSL